MRTRAGILLIIFALTLTLGLSACAGLLIRTGDPIPLIALKATARTALLVPTFGMSELLMWKHRREARFIERVQAHVGKWTYDDALKELGAPASSVEGEVVMVATWEESGVVVVNGSGRSHGWRLSLTFDRETGLLSLWRYSYY